MSVPTHGHPCSSESKRAMGNGSGCSAYPFTANHRVIKNRPPDEHRLQIKYGDVPRARSETHPLGFDVAGIDTSLVLGVNAEDGYVIALDPQRYDPLPMGVMVGWKQGDVDRIFEHGWHAWERDNHAGSRRLREDGPAFETLVGCLPSRFVDLIRFERRATQLGLDSALRLRAAQRHPGRTPDRTAPVHELEEQFDLDANAILEIIKSNHRLGVAVRGGVAEHHLERDLANTLGKEAVRALDEDGRPDFEVRHAGRRILIECKNASPHRYANGDFKVEVQKTRSQKNDPAGRFYRPDQFDVVATCLWAATDKWEFRFKRSSQLDRHSTFPDRLAAVHRVDSSWAASLDEVMESA